MKRAVVLSGGGSKGAYQIGVWKALKKLRISYDITTGTSVGALNAAMMTQKTFLRGLFLWYNLEFKNVIDEDMSNSNVKQIYKKYVKSAINGGMSINNLEKTIDKVLDVDKVYKSDVDLGIVTVKLRTLTPTLLTKKKIRKDKLKDYLIASASCFPAFQKKIIDEEAYIDGGLYDNLPINLAIDMGATEIIAVDLEEVGFKQKVKDDNIDITYIKPRNDIGSFLVFEKNASRRAIRLGYNDAMKTFNNFDGDRYTFKFGSLDKNYAKYIDKYLDTFKQLFDMDNSRFINKLVKIAAFKRIINLTNEDTLKKDFNKHIEELGYLLKIDDSYIYKVKNFNNELINRFSRLENDPEIENSIKKNKIRMLFSNGATVKYIYNLIKEKSSKLNKIALFFPNEFLDALYLYTIIN